MSDVVFWAVMVVTCGAPLAVIAIAGAYAIAVERALDGDS